MSSFATQYGIKLLSESLSWSEFITLLGGLMHDTPLGHMVTIRSESDPKRLKNYTPEQHAIRNQWCNRQAKTVSREEYNAFLSNIKSAFKSMSK